MRRFILAGCTFAALTLTVAADDKPEEWDTTKARGETRTIDFVTDEGTWMSADLSPDGRWIVFDLLAHVYRVPASGGEAECLTHDSGVAINFHPRYSPDGKTIAFVSDRKGQNNLWIMNADGSNPKAVFTDAKVRVFEPAWTPDGQYIVVRRQDLGGPLGPVINGIWMYHRDGGDGVELVGRDETGAAWPVVSPDGKYVYFHVAVGAAPPSGRRDVLSGTYQIKRIELKTGEISEVTAGEAQQQLRLSNGGAIAPQISPDGRWLAFARRIPDGTISYKGHRFGPRTALWLRDLQSGAERVAMDPIELDMSEGMKVWRLLPGYSWARDGRSIVISQGGKLRRLDPQTGEVTTIPISARVRRTLSQRAYRSFRINDEAFTARFLRWPTASPDGKALVFQAVGRIWVMSLPKGTPRRLLSADFEPYEYSPAWSPDGQWIAFTSFDEKRGGHLWKVPASGGRPQQLTTEPGEFLHPVWSPDGREIVVARGAGETARGRSTAANVWYDLVRVPADGGAVEFVVTVRHPSGGMRRQVVRASIAADGRVFYPEQKIERRDGREQPATELKSVRTDGTDRRTHLLFPFADEIAVSPSGEWAAFQEADNIYLTPLPLAGTGKDAPRLDKKKGKFAVRQLTKEGGLFPRWRDDRVLEYGTANRYFAYDVVAEKPEETQIALEVPRPIPRGTLALTGARIITLEKRRVIENGAVLVKDGRITCVGKCDVRQADHRIDASGGTIVPGLVDMHAHHYRDFGGITPSRSYETAIYLAYGVTTNLDNSMWSQAIFPVAELIDAGGAIGPRTFSTGDPLYRGEGPRQDEIGSYEAAEQNVKRLASWGAVSIKQYLQPRREQRQWIVEAARKIGVMVTSEGDSLEYNMSMIMDGQTAWEHPLSYTPLYSDVAKFFGRAGAVYSPTFIVGGAGPWNEEYFFQDSEVWKDPKQRQWLPWTQLIPHTRRRIVRPATDYSYPWIAQGLADVIAEGGHGAIGSHGQQHGIGSHWEIWMAASALGPMGALELASAHGAYFLGAERDLGSISTGKLADLIVLNANPLENIRNTANIRYVVKGGVVYEADTLDQIWPEKKPFGDHYWTNPDALRTDDRPVDYWDRSRRSSQRQQH